MTRNSPRLSDDTTKRRHNHRQSQSQSQLQYGDQQQELPPHKSHPHSRPASQHSQHSHRLGSPQAPSSPHRSPKTIHRLSKSSSSSSQNHHVPSPLKMVTTTAPVHSPPDDAQYYYLPEVDMPSEQHSGHAWMEPIVIDDEDLMFGGKSLSAWYEEERQSLGYPMEEGHEERRGRQRSRQQHHPHHHHHHHQHREHRHHHHPHHHMTSGTKNATASNDQKRH
ncbi:hypothetical protein GGR55DRAFT_382302 [Xylaria sp. FL0064]|nr:hypothetical protein GGR55DRAFT_382302 [Xylaria sp. FL0064]